MRARGIFMTRPPKPHGTTSAILCWSWRSQSSAQFQGEGTQTPPLHGKSVITLQREDVDGTAPLETVIDHNHNAREMGQSQNLNPGQPHCKTHTLKPWQYTAKKDSSYLNSESGTQNTTRREDINQQAYPEEGGQDVEMPGNNVI